ncbi:ComEC/Rec2 family competence protein [Microbacterium sp. VKM Ac-2923]|uniref:ComEC/Rec2 family competence protein n=1 Tax=Microbacterium sp. VKM Ac-2923 TaxID=2929476 RepID=UPI001FB4F3A9|nr:ComEC/Rec2 family competence protein [Microbacterium sp. VKM Ac-2923]MCJ1707476.1 ComEC/Rec2 family competence protein [Microbacterium sp. VKM Ac-2923]
MSGQKAIRRRALRPVSVAVTTWASAGLATSFPDAILLAVVLGILAGIATGVFVWRRHTAIAVMAVALACAAATAGTVASFAPGRGQVAALQAEGGRHLELTVTVTGRIDGSADGGAWFDAVASEVRAGDAVVVGAIPARVLVDVDGRAALSHASMGSTVELSGRAIPVEGGERAALVVRAGEVTAASEPEGMWAWFEGLRDRLVDSTRGLPQPGAGLVPGLAVGDTSSLDPATETAMTASSLSHLTAVSGANCAIVVGAAFALLALCGAPRGLRVGGAFVVLAAFVALVTPEPSVVRAAAMASVAMAALALGRPAIGVAVLSLGVTVLLVIDPWLAHSLGFALSTAATGALLVLARPLAGGLERWMPRALALAVAVPTSAQLVCGPLIVLIDPHVPLLGIAANLVADPAAAPATIAGALACIAPLPWLRDGLTALAWVPAAWIAAVAHTTAAVSAQNLPWPDGPGGAALLALVAGAVCLAIVRPRRLRRVTALASIAVAIVVGLTLGTAAVRTVAGPLTVPSAWQLAMCDVGQGDATLWRSASATALVDTGPEPGALTRCLTQFGIERLDLLVLTHFDLDHVGGSPAVLGRVGLVVHGPVDGDADQRLLDRFASGGARLQQATTGTTGTLGSTRWQALGPAPRTEPGNDASVAVDVAGADFPRTVMLGDLGEDSQAALRRRVDVPRVQVVKVSHHGSADQDADLYRDLHARVGLIGVGADNRYGHPTDKLLTMLRALGTAIGRTDRDGALAVWLNDDGGLMLWRERPETPADPGEPSPVSATTAMSTGRRGASTSRTRSPTRTARRPADGVGGAPVPSRRTDTRSDRGGACGVVGSAGAATRGRSIRDAVSEPVGRLGE